MNIKKLMILSLMIIFVMALTTGCVKPYHKPVFEEIQSHESAFLVPLEGDTTNQASLKSEEFYKKNLIAQKRIEIPYKWVKTGRFYWQGEYMPTMRLIKVDRSPVTREWTADPTTGTSTRNQGFEAESADSIGFITGISCTAQIEKEDAPKFLYRYNGRSLASIMDSEIRNKIGSKLVELYSKMTIEEIRVNKAEVIQKVREEIIPYFKERGITITNIGYIGQLTYLDKEIQRAINDKFVAEKAQQTQEIKNQTEIERAKAEAEAVRIRKQTLQDQIELKKLELQEKFLEKWNGVLPQVITGDSNMLMQLPLKDLR